MSDNDRPEVRAYRELESLVRGLGEELASFRKRALSAEAQLRDSGRSRSGSEKGAAGSERESELLSENESLRDRLSKAEEQIRHIIDRVRFLRQQMQSQGTAGAQR